MEAEAEKHGSCDESNSKFSNGSFHESILVTETSIRFCGNVPRRSQNLPSILLCKQDSHLRPPTSNTFQQASSSSVWLLVLRKLSSTCAKTLTNSHPSSFDHSTVSDRLRFVLQAHGLLRPLRTSKKISAPCGWDQGVKCYHNHQGRLGEPSRRMHLFPTITHAHGCFLENRSHLEVLEVEGSWTKVGDGWEKWTEVEGTISGCMEA